MIEFNIYIIQKSRKHQISVYIGRSIISRYQNPLYDQFAAELNLKLKPHANDIKISPNFISIAMSFPIDRIWSWNWFLGDLLIVNQELCFYDKIEPQIKTSCKPHQNKPKFYICGDLTPNRQNMKLQLLLRWFAYSSLRVVFLR
jgi:hypothetical protein